MTRLATDIAKAHHAAMNALTPDQRHAIERVQRALQVGVFNGRRFAENLGEVFEREAAQGA